MLGLLQISTFDGLPIKRDGQPVAGFTARKVEVPLGDLASVSRALIVTAYQSASGLINLITPTSAVVMGGLALGRVEFVKWLRFVLPLVVILLVLY